MNKVYITVGLSGSGKTHWANELVSENPNTVIVCKDDIRASMGAVVNGQRVEESKVIEKRNALIIAALEKGQNVIVADTNLNPIHEKNIRALVFPKYRGIYEIEVKSFLDTPVEVCIQRASKRPEGKDFWAGVIMKQKNEFIRPPIVEQDETLPKCIISDHDGTIAHVSPNRTPYDGTHSHEDLQNEIVCDYLRMMHEKGFKIFVLSGLEDKYKTHRENWLNANGVPYHELHMRKTGDPRKDCVIKDELFKEHIEGKYFVYAILDDRNQMTRYWVDKGYMNRLFTIGNPSHEF